MKTATIPHLNSFPNIRLAGKASPDVLNASEEQLAQMSEEMLAKLSGRVHRVGVKEPVVEPVPLRKSVAEAAGQNQQVTDAVSNVVAQIQKRSSPSVPVVLLFVGSEPNHHVDEMSARVAAALSDHAESRVLLIDSDDISKNLSTASRRLSDSGMTEVIEYNRDWHGSLLRNQDSNLDFLPVGNGQFGRWNQQELLRKAACDMKAEYQFICVAGGDAHSKAAKLWADVCDGSYLLVSVKNSNGTIAKSAVTELKSCGARLLGCIVTDVNDA